MLVKAWIPAFAGKTATAGKTPTVEIMAN